MFWSDLFEMMPYEFVLQIQFKYIRAFMWTLIQSISNMLTGWHVPVSMLVMQELGCFQIPGIVYRSLQHGAVHYHAATWGDGREWMAQQWASGSRHGISVHSKCHQ